MYNKLCTQNSQTLILSETSPQKLFVYKVYDIVT